MKIVICGDNNTGITFMDWSLYHLTGQGSHFQIPNGEETPICDDPLLSHNAHGHRNNREDDPGVGLDKLAAHRPAGGIESLCVHPPSLVTRMEDLMEFVHRLGDFHRDHGRVIFLVGEGHSHRWPSRSIRPITTDELRSLRTQMLEAARDPFQRAIIDKQTRTLGGLREYWAMSCVGRHDEIRSRDLRPVLAGLGFCVVEVRDWMDRPCETMETILRTMGMAPLPHRWRDWRGIALRWRQRTEHHNRKRWDGLIEAVIRGDDFEWGAMHLLQQSFLIHDVAKRSGRLIRARDLDDLPHNARDIHALLSQGPMAKTK